MRRLTKLDGLGQWDMKRCFDCSAEIAGENNQNCGMCDHWYEVLARLAAYEETGLEPEDIAGLAGGGAPARGEGIYEK